MSKFVIRGRKKLSGEIEAYGAKNAAIKMLAGSILLSGDVTLENVPDILDVQNICQILVRLGAKISRKGHTLKINTDSLSGSDPDPDLVRSIRASIVLVGPLLARFSQVKIFHPGGCVIGKRPIDRHLKAFRDLGVAVEETADYYQFKKGDRVGSEISFEKISVTATENILLFASAQEKEIKISNIALEPEVIDLIEFLNQAGAKISVQDRTATVCGNPKLSGIKYRVVSDRIEAGTFAILAATTKSELKILNANPDHLGSLLEIFTEIGIDFEAGPDYLKILPATHLKPIKLKTAEYPGFPTDLQSPMGVLLTQAEGTSEISETIFEHRLGYLEELKTMGANIEIINSRQAKITGPTNLVGRPIESLDLRSGATLLIAGLIAQGQTEIELAETIDRGYEHIEIRLKAIGADIERIA